MKLNDIADNPGSRKQRMRVGRGIGSGKGKTSGRGGKGQTARSGVRIKGFEGGQMPMHRRLPKRGFNNINAKRHAVINLGLLQKFIDAGKIDATAPVDEDVLIQSGLVRRKRDGIRLLAKGELTASVNLTLTGASKAAVEAIEKAGGSFTALAPAKAEAPAE